MPTLKNHRPKKKITLHRQEGKGAKFDYTKIITALKKIRKIFKRNKNKIENTDPCSNGHKYYPAEDIAPFFILLYCERCGHMIKRSTK